MKIVKKVQKLNEEKSVVEFVNIYGYRVENLSEENLRRLYINEEKSVIEIANIYGYRVDTIKKKLKEYDIDIYRIYRSELEQYYIYDKMTIVEIAYIYECRVDIIKKKLKEYNIPLRSSSEIGELKRGKYKGSNHHAWKGGSINYCSNFDDDCREHNREKYYRICLLCGKSEKDNVSKNGMKRRLSVHHVDYNKNQGCDYTLWKLVPLCSVCHLKVNIDRDYYEQIFTNIIIIKETLKDFDYKIDWRSIGTCYNLYYNISSKVNYINHKNDVMRIKFTKYENWLLNPEKLDVLLGLPEDEAVVVELNELSDKAKTANGPTCIINKMFIAGCLPLQAKANGKDKVIIMHTGEFNEDNYNIKRLQPSSGQITRVRKLLNINGYMNVDK